MSKAPQIPGMLSLPERIFQRPDLALVATGSLSCIRSLYQEAVRLEKTHQFFPCIQPAQAYAAGQNGLGLAKTLRQVLTIPEVGGVIIYASCLDVLSQTDFDSIIEGLENPRSVPIRVLLRGPMVKRYRRPREDLERMLAEIPERGTAIPREKRWFPPPRPDFYFVSSALQYMPAMPVLLTAGGCGGDPESDSGGRPDYRLGHTRFNDIQLTLGAEATAAAAVIEEATAQPEVHRDRKVYLLSSAVPTFAGLDRSAVGDAVSRKGFSVQDLGCDGFTAGEPALARALTTLTDLSAPGPAQPGKVDILGYCGAVLGKEALLAHGLEHLLKCGFDAGFWGAEGRQTNAAQLNWVVSASGLPQAEKLKKALGIPYLAGIPVGAKQMRLWRQTVNSILGHEEQLQQMPLGTPLLQGKRALVMGEPLLIQSIGRYLTDEQGCDHVTLAVYAPRPEQRQFYRRLFPQGTYSFFESPQELRALTQNADLLLGDPEFDLGLLPLVPIPDPQVSGNRYAHIPYEIFGKKGAAWIAENIKTIFYKGETV